MKHDLKHSKTLQNIKNMINILPAALADIKNFLKRCLFALQGAYFGFLWLICSEISDEIPE